MLASAYRRGWSHGHGIARHNVPTIGQEVNNWDVFVGLVTAENVREYHELRCDAVARDTRQFSPFEFIATEFDAHLEYPEDERLINDLEEAFSDGTTDAIRADIADFTDGDYGIEKEQ
jgi:hypothetical protein